MKIITYGNLASQAMNSNAYYISLQLVVFILPFLEVRDKVFWPFLEY